jgi:hypothetical protein
VAPEEIGRAHKIESIWRLDTLIVADEPIEEVVEDKEHEDQVVCCPNEWIGVSNDF